jgi:thiamine pyrophosphokinase
VTKNNPAGRILHFPDGVTILGGGPVTADDLDLALSLTGGLVCADGGANSLGDRVPDAIIGDLDSVQDRERWAALLDDRLIQLEEQDSTDFEKCLRIVDAPFIIGIGFLGGRIDHELAALHALVGARSHVVLLGRDDVILTAGTRFGLGLNPGDRFSIFPLRPVRALSSEGLKWPLAGLHFAAGARIGTSNEVSAATVRIEFSDDGALIILSRDRLGAALAARSLQTDVSVGRGAG